MTFQSALGMLLLFGLVAWVAYVLTEDSKRPPRYPEQEDDL